MTSESDWLRMILTDPTDIHTRLIFADWLEEHDDPEWAGFIRENRQPDLTTGRWWEPFKSIVGMWRATWDRGFVQKIELPTDAFMGHCEELFRTHPIEQVRLTDAEPALFLGTDRHCWVLQEGCAIDFKVPGSLPIELFDLVRGYSELLGERNVNSNRCGALGFPNPTTATSALSDACVRYGRKQAGLPELVTSTG